MSNFSELQRTFIAYCQADGQNLMTAIEKLETRLYGDVVECLNGEFSTGSFTDENDLNVPALYLTYEEANTAHEEAMKDWADYHDEDDEYEGRVMAVRWNHYDELEFFEVTDDGVPTSPDAIGGNSVNRAMGL